MTLAANEPARKHFLSGTCIIPREIAELDYFKKEKRVFSRQDALAWIASNVRYVDNCVLKRWQNTWSLRYLADIWGWTVKRVRCFLEKLENWGIIGTTLGKIKGTAQIVITYLVQRLDWSSESARAQQGHSKGTARAQYKERQEGKKEKEDSCEVRAPHDSEFGPRIETADKPSEADSSFEEFWETCPKREGNPGSKHQLQEKWRKLSLAVRQQALAGAKRWAANVRRNPPDSRSKIPMIQTWFNGRRWETEPDLTPKSAAKSRYERPACLQY